MAADNKELVIESKIIQEEQIEKMEVDRELNNNNNNQYQDTFFYFEDKTDWSSHALKPTSCVWSK